MTIHAQIIFKLHKILTYQKMVLSYTLILQSLLHKNRHLIKLVWRTCINSNCNSNQIYFFKYATVLRVSSWHDNKMIGGFVLYWHGTGQRKLKSTPTHRYNFRSSELCSSAASFLVKDRVESDGSSRWLLPANLYILVIMNSNGLMLELLRIWLNKLIIISCYSYIFFTPISNVQD